LELSRNCCAAVLRSLHNATQSLHNRYDLTTLLRCNRFAIASKLLYNRVSSFLVL
jgi:hypothetical protein